MKRRLQERRGNSRTLASRSTTLPNNLNTRDYLANKRNKDLQAILCEQSPEPKRKTESRNSFSPTSSNFSSESYSPCPDQENPAITPQVPSKPHKQLQLPDVKFDLGKLLTAKITTTESKNQTNKRKKRLNNSESTTTPPKFENEDKKLRTLYKKSATLLSYQPKYGDLTKYVSSIHSRPESTASNSPTDRIQVTPDSLEKQQNAQFYLPAPASASKISSSNLETAFYKSLQPRRLLEWSESKNDYLTLQNYMSSLKVRKYKLKLSHKALERHEELEPRMRSILFDWLMEVCDCFQLQRSTFYMAQYYVDAYLSVTGRAPKSASSFTSNPETPVTASPMSSVNMESPLLSSITAGHNISCNTTLQANEQTPDSCFVSENDDSPKIDGKKGGQVSKLRLQLLGITALFLAAKIEEIDPPRLARFSYITDGACTDEDIQIQEMDLLQTLNWIMNPVTVYDWLRLYLQTTYHYLVKPKTKASPRVTRQTAKKQQTSASESSPSLSTMEVSRCYIEDVNFNEMVFVQMCQLLDLSILDVNSLKWQPYELAASILYHFSSQNTAKRASNVNILKLVECVSWLTPMALTLKEAGLESKPSEYSQCDDNPRDYRRVPPSQWYNLQSQNGDTLGLLENVYKKREEQAKTSSSSDEN